jgi:dienelactone hydrolase
MKKILEDTRIVAGKVTLNGNLVISEGAQGIVLFAHGSGSSRFSRRNNYVAEMLQKHKLATLLMDLLTETEEQIDLVTRELRFDIPMLAERLVGAAEWLKKNPKTMNLHLGCFGSSTGAAAALIAAAKLPDVVKAVVSRGGRPDLAMEYLPKVKAPTLLIVGGNDESVIGLNETALQQLHGLKKLEIVPDATHLFEEPRKLEEVAKLAAEWFVRYLK